MASENTHRVAYDFCMEIDIFSKYSSKHSFFVQTEASIEEDSIIHFRLCWFEEQTLSFLSLALAFLLFALAIVRICYAFLLTNI